MNNVCVKSVNHRKGMSCVLPFNVHCWETGGEEATSVHSLRGTSSSSWSWLGQSLVF